MNTQNTAQNNEQTTLLNPFNTTGLNEEQLALCAGATSEFCHEDGLPGY